MTLLDRPSSGLLPYWVGTFWAEGAWDLAKTVGNFVTVKADGLHGDHLQAFADSQLPFVLEIYFNQARLTEQAGWIAYCEHLHRLLHEHALIDRMIGVQFGDELYSWLTHTETHSEWPALALLPPLNGKPRLYLLPIITGYLAERAVDMRRVFGSDMKPIGINETGGVDPGPLPGEVEWLAVDAYLDAPITRESFKKVIRAYEGAAAKGLPLMAVLPCAYSTSPGDPMQEAPTLAQLAWYLEVLDRFTPFAMQYFCLKHPGHGAEAYGLTDLPHLLGPLQAIWQGRVVA